MKKKIILLVILFCLIILTACSKSSTEVEDEYTSYYITVTNNSSSDIIELTISMVGSDDLQQINVLPFDETTQNFEFQLPEPSGDTPFSYGDYNFSYLQNDEEIYFGFILPETHISVYINDDGYTVENMTYYITINNLSSYNVTDIEISMIGALESFQVDELSPGENSSELEFHLIDSGPVPSSFGCYIGSYLQNDITKLIFFAPYGQTNITMIILDDSIEWYINN